MERRGNKRRTYARPNDNYYIDPDLDGILPAKYMSPLYQTSEFQRMRNREGFLKDSMSNRSGAIEDEIYFLCHCEEYKELGAKFIQCWEINYGTNFAESDGINSIFQSTKTNILVLANNFIAGLYPIRDSLTLKMWIKYTAQII